MTFKCLCGILYNFIGHASSKETNSDMLGISIIIVCIIGLIAAIIIALLIVQLSRTGQPTPTQPWERAGEDGEDIAQDVIRSVQKGTDALLNNVEIVVDGREAEFDNVIINNRGVFIIEVKNYTGILYGTEEDYHWHKERISRGGNVYGKQVINPIRQVKRQIYLMAQYLKYYGCNVWIEGYVYFVNGNSPVKNDSVLESADDIDNAIHNGHNNRLNQKQVEQILSLLS